MDSVVTTVVESSQSYAEEISEYSDLIHTYGASTVIISVFLVILLAILGYILRSSHKTNNQLIKQQQELVDMLLARNNEKKEKEAEEDEKKVEVVKEPDIVESFLNINSSLKEILKDISTIINTDRIALYVFHNGVYSSHGLPFFKMSCVCEIVKKNSGVMGNIKSHANLPLQIFDNSISYLAKHGKMTIIDTEDDENNELVHNTPVLIGMLKSNNIRSATGIAIYDNNDNILAIMIAEFSDVKDTEFLTNTENTLIEKAPLLSPILEYSGIYKTTNK